MKSHHAVSRARSKKPVLAVDFDDVVVETLPHLISTYNREFETNVRLEEQYMPGGFGNSDWGWKHNREGAIQWVCQYLSRPDKLSTPPISSAINSLTRLSQRYQIVILTGRRSDINHLTCDWLERNMPGVVTEVYHASGGLKSRVCQDIGATIIIDDSPEYIHDCHSTGIEVIVFGDYPWNRPNRLPEEAPRAKNWKEVEEILL